MTDPSDYPGYRERPQTAYNAPRVPVVPFTPLPPPGGLKYESATQRELELGQIIGPGRYVPPSSEVRIKDPVTGGEKGQKLERFDLIPFDALSDVARVYGVGAKKYAEWNWAKGYKWSLSLGALLRHIALWAIGIDNDKETGLPHMAHACWHTLTLLTFASRKLGTDDRSKPTLGA